MRSGIDVAALSPDVRPQDDLYRYVNGRRLAETEIPPDRAIDGAFHHLRDLSEERMHAILERAAADAGSGDGAGSADDAGSASDAGPADGSDDADRADRTKIGDLYASFMDADTVERLGVEPVRGDLDRIAAVGDADAFVRLLGDLQRHGVGGAFAFYVSPDEKASDRYVVHLAQAGLGLPDESFYREDRFAPIREAYVAHLTRLLGLAGQPDAADAAARVMALETRLAGGHWDRVASRDATKTYTKLDRAGLEEVSAGWPWREWLDGFRAYGSVLDEVVVRQPDYLATLGSAIREVPLADWQAWLAVRLLSAAAPYLSEAFVDESFDFYGRTLTGTPENRARWKRGVALVDALLGEALGRIYVAEHFPPAAKARMVELVANLVEAYRRNIGALDWMSQQTKARALEKLGKFTTKIAYPDKWRDYSALEIRRDDLVGNVRRAASFETDRALGKLGRPVDRAEWFMTPPTVNAYYNPGANEIVFPAGILQPPFFDPEADDAVNYGGIGAVIGHEIGHGFDDQGSKYDGDGNLEDWWTAEDRARFEERTRKLIDQYDVLEPAETPGSSVNGALTVGENIGDLGGLTIAYQAYRISLDGAAPPVLDGFTGWQRVFLGWAEVWRTAIRPEEALRRLSVDPHSPGEWRCNGVLRNLEEFYEAFDVHEGDALWLPAEERVRIW